MNQGVQSYSQALEQLGVVLRQECYSASDGARLKRQIQDSYGHWAQKQYDKAFLNWGLWDSRLYREYRALQYDFSSVCSVQDIFAQLLMFYLVRPLVEKNFFNKRLLDVGCGNGIGLKMSTDLLKTNYALGIDLVDKLVKNSLGNFFEKGKIEFLQSDAENLALEDESFDIITNLESSHLYPKIEDFFSEVARVLSPNGYFCYADIHFENKQQMKKLEDFVMQNKNIEIIQKWISQVGSRLQFITV